MNREAAETWDFPGTSPHTAGWGCSRHPPQRVLRRKKRGGGGAGVAPGQGGVRTPARRKDRGEGGGAPRVCPKQERCNSPSRPGPRGRAGALRPAPSALLPGGAAQSGARRTPGRLPAFPGLPPPGSTSQGPGSRRLEGCPAPCPLGPRTPPRRLRPPRG